MPSPGDAAVRVELPGLDRHPRRGVKGSRRASAVELHNVQDVEEIRSELEPAGLLELPEAEPPNDRRVHVIDGTATHVVAGRIHAHAAVTRALYHRNIELCQRITG